MKQLSALILFAIIGDVLLAWAGKSLREPTPTVRSTRMEMVLGLTGIQYLLPFVPLIPLAFICLSRLLSCFNSID